MQVQVLRESGAQLSVETCVVDLVSWLGLLPGEAPQPPMFATGQPGLPVPGLHLPPAQPEDAAALPAGTLPTHLAARSASPQLLCSTSTSVSSRTKMGMVSPQLLLPEFSGHPQLPLLPPPPPPSSPLLTQRLRSSEPYMWCSMASSRSSAGPWRPCVTSPRTSARSCWIRYRHHLCCPIASHSDLKAWLCPALLRAV